jgi:pyruvate/2-oxoglutarate dehydrogenase complex dihydrolipoamide acyltransferase (E2) component
MSLTLSVDHRVIDSALGTAFLEALKASLENLAGMLA